MMLAIGIVLMLVGLVLTELAYYSDDDYNW